MLKQFVQFPQAGVLSVLCFLHVHRRVLQSVRQLHLIIGSSFSGAGASAVCCGTNPSSHTVATPTLSGEVHQQIPSILGLAGTHAYCDIWLLLTLVVGSVDERALHLMRPSPGTVDAGGSPGYQSIFRCRGSPMLSLLHMSHCVLKLNVYAAHSPAHHTRCSFGIS